MNATFDITADYMSYITAVAEFILSAYSLRKQLTHFGINKTLNVGTELEIFIPTVKD